MPTGTRQLLARQLIRPTIDGPGYVGAFDPQSRTTGGIVAVANGYQALLLGGLAAVDRMDFARLTWRVADLLSAGESADIALQLVAQMKIRTHVGNSTDATALLLWHNEEDPTTATADGLSAEFLWAAATRTVRAARCLNGAVLDTSLGVGSTTTDRMHAQFGRDGAGAALSSIVSGRDASGVTTGAPSIGPGPLSAAQFGALAPTFLSLMMGRTANTAGDVTPVVDFGVIATSFGDIA